MDLRRCGAVGVTPPRLTVSMVRIDAAIAERAREQLSLITYEQLNALGCTRQMRRTRVRNGVLVPAGHQVLRVAAAPCTWEQMALAAQLDVGAPGAVSHMTAARLWGFDGIRPGAIELVVPFAHHPRPARGRVHRVADLATDDVRMRHPFNLTSPERTLVDIAGRCTPLHLETILDLAARDGLLSIDTVGTALDRLRHPGRPGVRRLDAVLGRPTLRQRADSWLERQLLALMAAAGLPPPRTQVELERSDGQVARVDAFYDDARLVIEVDGHRTHSTRRQRQADAEREAALVARGWRVIRFTYEDVTERPAYVAATIATHLRQLLIARP